MTPPLHRVVVGPDADAEAAPPVCRSPDLRLCFEGERRNVALERDKIRRGLGTDMPARLWDLLEIAVAVYSADIAFRRGDNEHWVRSCSFLIPVREPGFWREAEPQLARLLYRLCHDTYTFEFCERTGDEAAPESEERGAGECVDCASLLSGGIDSFAGAAVLLGAGRSAVFVAHRPHNTVVSAAQDHVVQCLRKRHGDAARFVALSCGPAAASQSAHPFPSPEEREPSQRSRSFLYMTLGALACRATGASELVCPENGVLAINPPLTGARVGGYTTAGTRPTSLASFRDLLSSVGLDVNVVNPFLYHTKGELLRDVLRPQFSTEEIQGAVSCWMAGRISRPCGTCIPCIVRAISMHTAGLLPEAHVVQPLEPVEGATGSGTAVRANLVDLLTFVRRLRRCSDGELVRLWPVLLDIAPHAELPGALSMLRRFAEQAEDAIGGDG